MTDFDDWNSYGRRRRGGSLLARLDAGEAQLLRATVLRLAGGLEGPRLAMLARGLWGWLAEHGASIGATVAELPDDSDAARGEAVRTALAALKQVRGGRRPTPLDRRMTWLGDALALDPVDRALAGAYARVSLFDAWRDLLEALGMSRWLEPKTAAALIGIHPTEAEERLEPGAALYRFGLITADHDGDRRINPFLRRIARMSATDPATLTRRMLPPAPASTLDWADFAHLGPLTDVTLAATRAAAAQGRGVNILLHGAPGTGKSEFARALAGEAGLCAVFAGLADDEGGEPSRYERLAHLSVLRALTRGQSGGDRRHLLVVDEADDVLTLGRDDRGQRSKLWLNRLVEEVATPTVWIVNEPELLGPAIVRRMTLALGFDLPPPAVRLRVVERAAAAAGLTLDPQAAHGAAAVPAAPAVLANAVAAVALAGTPAQLPDVALELNRALGAREPGTARRPLNYDPALAQADRDLGVLADRLAGAPWRTWSLLLSGPSGTGKSAYARHLAERLGIGVEERRGSDLLDPYVGGTEAKIAAAFRDAGRAGALLLIDEADDFLFDRRRAERSWESAMVNEMLRAMERQAGPFVATTNLADLLDPAAQRRFTLHVRFRALTPGRAAALFAATFGRALPAGTEPLDALTPGDFAVVSDRARLLGEADPAVLVRELRAEAEARGHGGGRAGFHPPALRWEEA